MQFCAWSDQHLLSSQHPAPELVLNAVDRQKNVSDAGWKFDSKLVSNCFGQLWLYTIQCSALFELHRGRPSDEQHCVAQHSLEHSWSVWMTHKKRLARTRNYVTTAGPESLQQLTSARFGATGYLREPLCYAYRTRRAALGWAHP
jgi:hypothetical protein